MKNNNRLIKLITGMQAKKTATSTFLEVLLPKVSYTRSFLPLGCHLRLPVEPFSPFVQRMGQNGYKSKSTPQNSGTTF